MLTRNSSLNLHLGLAKLEKCVEVFVTWEHCGLLQFAALQGSQHTWTSWLAGRLLVKLKGRSILLAAVPQKLS